VRVLMILYYVPPSEVVAALRVRRLVSRLPGHGVEPVIVAPGAGAWGAPGVRMERFAGPDPLAAVHAARGPESAPARRRFGALKRWVRSFQVPDERWPLRAAWTREARVAGKGVDVVYSSSGPYTAHLVARDAARALGKPWVMELRDLWSDSTYHPQHANPLSRLRNFRMESRCVRDATRIVVLTEAHRVHAAARFSEHAARFRMIPNAFEPGLPERRPARGPLRLLYAGNLYGGRTLAPLAAAVAGLDSVPGFEGVVLEIAGRSFDHPWDQALAGNRERVVIHGPLPHARVRELLAEVHAGVVHNPASDRIHIPGKVYDYLGAAIPVLDLTLQPDIPSLGTGVAWHRRAAAHDVAGLRDAVLDIAAWWREHPEGAPRPGDAHPLSAASVAGGLAAVLDEAAC